MTVEGILLHPGEARMVSLRGTHIGFLVIGEHAQGASAFEVTAAAGFDTGVHIHHHMEEFFYIVEGEVNLRLGDQDGRGGPGAFVFVPMGVAHGIANAGNTPAKWIAIASPPGYERFFEQLADLLAREGPPDNTAIAALREQYDTEQLSALTSGS